MTQLLSVLHLVVLTAFVGLASVYMLMSLISYLRVRRPLMTWSGRVRWWASPVGPALIAVGATGGMGTAWAAGTEVPASAAIGYPAGALFWAVGAHLARTTVVTEYGLLPDINRISRAVSWGQVVDYFARSRGQYTCYVFLYETAPSADRQRLELHVPVGQAAAFRDVVEAKLDARFAFEADSPRRVVSGR